MLVLKEPGSESILSFKGWIRIRIDFKSWIRIETNTDPKHWFYYYLVVANNAESDLGATFLVPRNVSIFYIFTTC